MTTHELAHKLLTLPNTNVSVSIDISKDESDYDARAFGDNLFEILEELHMNRVTLIKLMIN